MERIAKILSVKKLFSNYSFDIPKYQRGYSWEKEQVVTFLTDIISNDKYFLGSILVTRSSNEKKFEIIDGQQRMITIYLCFLALKNLKKLKLLDGDLKLDNLVSDKISIEAVAADDYCKVFEYLLLGGELPSALKKTSIVKNYDIIYDTLSKNKSEISNFLTHLINAKLFVLDMSFDSITPYGIFLNLNTKGKRLDLVDIVKSHLFDALASSTSFGAIKNNWYKTIDSIDYKNTDDYLRKYVTLEKGEKNQCKEEEVIKYFKEKAQSIDEVRKIIDSIGNENGDYYTIYNAVQKGSSTAYVALINDNNVHIDKVFEYFTFLKKIAFKQFDICFIGMLHFIPKSKNNSKQKIIDNMNLFVDFIQLVFLYACRQQLQNTSPSTYGNKFIALAGKMYNDKTNIRKELVNVLEEFKIEKLSDDRNLDFLDKKEFNQNSKQLKIAVALISFLDGATTCDFSGEHFLAESSNNGEKDSLGNIIPVIHDIYGVNEPTKKLEMYERYKTSEKCINIFLEKDVENGKYDIKERTNRYKTLYKDKYNALIDSIIGGDKND